MRSAAVCNESISSGERERTATKASSISSRRRFASFSVSCSARVFWEAVACWFIAGNNIERKTRVLIYAKLNYASGLLHGLSADCKSDICGLIQASGASGFCRISEQSRPISPMIPSKKSFTAAEWKLVQRLNTPAKVQRFFTSLPYNWEKNGATMRSFREVLKRKEAHCLEAAVSAAVILEQHGYPPLLLDLESQDLLDHVVFAFQENGRWGSIARSRDFGLHGRKAVFRSIRDLALSYSDPFVDFTGRLKGYGLTSLYELGNYDWRFSSRKMAKIEDQLRAIPHKPIQSSDKRYEKLLARYHAYKTRYPDRTPGYYDNRSTWLL
jgi:hypothetical protein